MKTQKVLLWCRNTCRRRKGSIQKPQNLRCNIQQDRACTLKLKLSQDLKFFPGGKLHTTDLRKHLLLLNTC